MVFVCHYIRVVLPAGMLTMYPWHRDRPLLTFLTLLLVPSSLTFLTLLIHRIRLARAAQRDRAPEGIVHGLPWRVWTGTGWEKHSGIAPGQTMDAASSQNEDEAERGESNALPQHCVEEDEDPAWFQSQVECAICLEEFIKGDRVRVLPCKHIFHLEEVDGWLIERKKLVSFLACSQPSFVCAKFDCCCKCPVCKADVTQPRPLGTNAAQRIENSAEPSTSRSPSRSASSAPSERTPLLQDGPSSGSHPL